MTQIRWLCCSLAVAAVACARTTTPFVADVGAISVAADAYLVHRDSVARVQANASDSDRHTMVGAPSQHRWVAVVRVTPEYLQARVGDTLVPWQAIRVSGLDSLGTLVPAAVPLFGPFRGGGVVRPLGDGRWLAVKVGRAEIGVRTMQLVQAVGMDTAHVRSIAVEVRP